MVVGTDRGATLAADDWHLFTTGTVVEATATANTTATTSATSDDTVPAAPELPGSPDQPAGLPEEPVEPTPSTVTGSQLDGAPPQSNASDELIATPALVTPKPNLANLPPTLDVARSSPLSIAESQSVTSRQPRPQADAKSVNSPSGNGAATQPNVNSPRKLLAGAKDEAEWMKKKRTLDYFRGTIKFGSLSNVIEHWYELEGLLGFLETVSIPFNVSCPTACSWTCIDPGGISNGNTAGGCPPVLQERP